MSRSLLTQLEQIRRSATYDDQVANVTNSAVAEPTVSGSLEEDLNVIRTLMRLVKGSTNWYDSLGNYFDPTNTTSGNAEQKALNILNLKNNTLDAKTIIVPVVSDNSGAGYSVSGTQDGFLVNLTTQYATAADRAGLPIYSSTTGSYYDEGGALDVCAVDIVSVSNNTSITTSGGDVIYGLFYDGIDYSGTGDGTDVYIKFFANGSQTTFPTGYETVTVVSSGTYTPPSGDDVNFDFGGGYVTPSGNLINFDFTTESTSGGVKIVYPHRRVMTDLAEYEWFRTDFITKVEGDPILAADIRNLQGYTGSSDGDNSTAGSWTSTTGNYGLNGNPSDLQEAIDDLNTFFGDLSFTENNYILDGSSIADALDELDQQIKDNADAIGSSFGGSKYTESVTSTITKNIEHTLPYSITYTPDATVGQQGKNMEVYVNGQLIMADTGTNGANADRDYGETTTSGITFRFDVVADANIVYVVRQ